jgi:hypothetical protein
VSKLKACDNLEEEFMDVLAVFAAYSDGYEYVMDLVDKSQIRDKWKRWVQRVKAGQEG